MRCSPDFSIHIPLSPIHQLSTKHSSAQSAKSHSIIAKMASSLQIPKPTKGNVAQLSHSTPLPSVSPASVTPKPSTHRSHQELRSILKRAPPIDPSGFALPPSSSPPIDPTKLPLPPSPANSTTGKPIYIPGRRGEFEYDFCESEFDDLPPGFPYNDWNGALCFAWEYIRNMQRLVTELMEGTGKYHGIRHTT